MKTKILLLIITALFIYSCNWFKKPEYYNYYYLPDSLHFPMETGDTVIFSCNTEDTVIYDTFYILKDVNMVTTFRSIGYPTGESEVEYVYYNNKKKGHKFAYSLEIWSGTTEPSFIVYWALQYNCERANKTHISSLVINGKVYHNLLKSDSLALCDSLYPQLYDFYYNIKNGLVKFTTDDRLTFELYAYKKLQCGILK